MRRGSRARGHGLRPPQPGGIRPDAGDCRRGDRRRSCLAEPPHLFDARDDRAGRRHDDSGNRSRPDGVAPGAGADARRAGGRREDHRPRRAQQARPGAHGRRARRDQGRRFDLSLACERPAYGAAAPAGSREPRRLLGAAAGQLHAAVPRSGSYAAGHSSNARGMADRTTLRAAEATCISYPMPMLSLLSVQRSVEIDDSRVTIEFDWMGAEQVIHLDRPGIRRTSSHPCSDIRSAHWEGDTLVVDTVATYPHRQGIAHGVPSTAAKHTIERLTLGADSRHIDYQITVEDSGALTEPYTVGANLGLSPRLWSRPWSAPCDPEIAARFMRGLLAPGQRRGHPLITIVRPSTRRRRQLGQSARMSEPLRAISYRGRHITGARVAGASVDGRDPAAATRARWRARFRTSLPRSATRCIRADMRSGLFGARATSASTLGEAVASSRAQVPTRRSCSISTPRNPPDCRCQSDA